ncbi:hypothetical protein H8356DRAFT_1344694 [Neocallimastix lanati (nom. inval.)]|nr:hypothetical protein H8356DRAFT_1344694 [Neocallimastix sp. JGI-2020a]
MNGIVFLFLPLSITLSIGCVGSLLYIYYKNHLKCVYTNEDLTQELNEQNNWFKHIDFTECDEELLYNFVLYEDDKMTFNFYQNPSNLAFMDNKFQFVLNAYVDKSSCRKYVCFSLARLLGAIEGSLCDMMDSVYDDHLKHTCLVLRIISIRRFIKHFFDDITNEIINSKKQKNPILYVNLD